MEENSSNGEWFNGEDKTEIIEKKVEKKVEKMKPAPFEKLPNDIIIFNIFSYLNFSFSKFVDKMKTFSLLGYFKDSSTGKVDRKPYCIFRHIRFTSDWPFDVYYHAYESPILLLSEIESISFYEFPCFYEFITLKGKSWSDLRKLELIGVKTWYAKKIVLYEDKNNYDTYFDEEKKFVCTYSKIPPNDIRNFYDENYFKIDNLFINDKFPSLNELKIKDCLVFGRGWNVNNLKRLTKFNVKTRYWEKNQKKLLRNTFNENFYKNKKYLELLKGVDIYIEVNTFTKEYAKLKLFHNDLAGLTITNDYVDFKDCYKNLKSLKILSLSFKSFIDFLYFPKLENLSLSSNSIIVDKIIFVNFYAKNLKKLSLKKITKFFRITTEDSKNFSNLEYLSMNDCNLKSMEWRVKKLKTLKIRFCNGMFQSIEQFLCDNSFDYLENLIVGETRILSSPNIWEWSKMPNLYMLKFTKMRLDKHFIQGYYFKNLKILVCLDCYFEPDILNEKIIKEKNIVKSLKLLSVDYLDSIKKFFKFEEVGKIDWQKKVSFSTFSGCFSNSSTIFLKNYGVIPITKVERGQLIQSTMNSKGKIIYSKILSIISHSLPRIVYNLNDFIKITGDHLIFVFRNKQSKEKLIKVKDLKIGDYLKKKNQLIKITKIQLEKDLVTNVFTKSGKIIVNGIFSSVYTSKKDKKFYPLRRLSSFLFKKNNLKVEHFLKKKLRSLKNYN